MKWILLIVYMVKRLTWMARYARHFSKKTDTSFSFGWESATVATQEYSDWLEEKPEDSADEELSYWT